MIRALRIVATVGLWMLGALGLAGATLWALAQLGIAQPLVVVSESMRPTLHSGDVILAVRVPVDELVPGDVVSVARDHEARFITHRLIRATPAAADDGWSLVLKGDANPVADPVAYRVGSDALKVVWAAPLGLPVGLFAGDGAESRSGSGSGVSVFLGLAEASWTDAVHAMVELSSPVPGPAPYAIATSSAWNQLVGTSEAVCHEDATIEYDWAPAGAWSTLGGGGDSNAIDLGLTWNQYATLHTSARCWQDGRASDWVPATNNGIGQVIRWPYIYDTSGYTNGSTKRFEAHFACPQWTTSATTKIGVRRNGSYPTTVLWSAASPDLVAHWSGTMGNGSVWMSVDCVGPWGVAHVEGSHRFGPGCVPSIVVAICTDYYRG